MTTIGPLRGSTQNVPEMTPAPARLRQCQWVPSVELKIPADWLSGVYLGKLTTIPDARSDPYWQSYVVFIVRDDRPADILFQCSDNTWQAYNRWPVNESLYTHPDGAHAPDVAVSFDRPYGMYTQIFDAALSVGSGEFLLWEYPLCSTGWSSMATTSHMAPIVTRSTHHLLLVVVRILASGMMSIGIFDNIAPQKPRLKAA